LSELEYLRDYMRDLLDKKMKTLDKALLMIPDDKLSFKPIDDTMTAAELGIHVHESALVVAGAVGKDDFSREDLQLIPFDKTGVQTAQDIVDHGNKVKEYVKKGTARIDRGFDEQGSQVLNLGGFLRESWTCFANCF